MTLEDPDTVGHLQPRKNDRLTIGRVIAILAGIVPFILVCTLPYGEDFAMGWWMFPLRTISRVTVDIPSLVVGTIAFVGFTICTHVTGRWVASWMPSGVLPGSHWTKRQTYSLVGLVVLMFALGTALVGGVHQVVWLMSARSAPSLIIDDEDEILPPVAAVQTSANRSENKNRLKNMGYAVFNYEETYRFLPAGRSESASGTPLHGWPIQLSGFHVYSARGVDWNRPWNEAPNDQLFRCQLRCFVNPTMPGKLFDADGYGLNHFAANVHVFPPFRYGEKPTVDGRPVGMKVREIRDGMSNTILLGTARGNFKPWASPDGLRDPMLGINRSLDGFGGAPGSPAAMFEMGDGSIRTLNSKVDPAVLKALATPNGGEPTPDSP